MRLQVLSDLHLEVRPFKLVLAEGVDALVLAGDLASFHAHHRLAQLLDSVRQVPVIMVRGNHDHYGDDITAPLLAGVLRSFPNVTLLDNSYADIGGVRFVGGTLWTDWSLARPGLKLVDMGVAARCIRDFTSILVHDKGGNRFIAPHDMRYEHQKCTEAILKHANVRTVVVTHFLPLKESIDPRFAGDPVNAYFASDCSELLRETKPLLLVHGHTHCGFDYRFESTRILCNPRGYDDRENKSFSPTLTVEV